MAARTCACGTPVNREGLDPETPYWLRQLAERIPVVCDGCIAESAERERQAAVERDVLEQTAAARRRLHSSGIPATLRLTWAQVSAGTRPDVLAAA
jgi:hypothetical protein